MKKVLRRVISVICVFALVVAILPVNVAEAASAKKLKKGKTTKVTVSYKGDTITVTLVGANTNAVCKGHPSWVSVKHNGGTSFTITVKDRHYGWIPLVGYMSKSEAVARTGDVVFVQGNKVYTLRISQNANPAYVAYYARQVIGKVCYKVGMKLIEKALTK